MIAMMSNKKEHEESIMRNVFNLKTLMINIKISTQRITIRIGRTLLILNMLLSTCLIGDVSVRIAIGTGCIFRSFVTFRYNPILVGLRLLLKITYNSIYRRYFRILVSDIRMTIIDV